jgi:hypothetical protein
MRLVPRQQALSQLAQSNTLQATIARALAGMVRRMAMLGVSREVLASMLRQHGEDDLAERALSLSDDELARIGTLGAYYAFSEDAVALGGSMGGTRALSPPCQGEVRQILLLDY